MPAPSSARAGHAAVLAMSAMEARSVRRFGRGVSSVIVVLPSNAALSPLPVGERVGVRGFKR
jgi:hypothetical protein